MKQEAQHISMSSTRRQPGRSCTLGSSLKILPPPLRLEQCHRYRRLAADPFWKVNQLQATGSLTADALQIYDR